MYRTKCFTCFTVTVLRVSSTLARLYAWGCVFVAESDRVTLWPCSTLSQIRQGLCPIVSPSRNNHTGLMFRSVFQVSQSVFAVRFGRFGPARRLRWEIVHVATLELIRLPLCYRQRPTTKCGPSPSRSSHPRPRTRACVTSSPCSAWLRTVPSSRMRSLTTCTLRIMLRSGETNG